MKWWCIEKDQCENAQKKEKKKKRKRKGFDSIMWLVLIKNWILG
jgi:hypothetical protein